VEVEVEVGEYCSSVCSPTCSIVIIIIFFSFFYFFIIKYISRIEQLFGQLLVEVKNVAFSLSSPKHTTKRAKSNPIKLIVLFR
jgi:hypothetical protein